MKNGALQVSMKSMENKYFLMITSMPTGRDGCSCLKEINKLKFDELHRLKKKKGDKYFCRSPGILFLSTDRLTSRFSKER